MSQAALGAAWQDWAAHLLLSPAKQIELGIQAAADGAEAVRPLAQDKRFADPAFQAWPWNAVSQGFLLSQKWWHRATSGMRGVSPHHADVVIFGARQLLDGVAPSNFLATNPVAQQLTRARCGEDVLRGALRCSAVRTCAACCSDPPRSPSGPGAKSPSRPARW